MEVVDGSENYNNKFMVNGFYLRKYANKEAEKIRKVDDNDKILNNFLFSAYSSFTGITMPIFNVFKNISQGVSNAFSSFADFTLGTKVNNDRIIAMLSDWFENERMIYNKCVFISYLGSFYDKVNEDSNIDKNLIYLCTDNRISNLSLLSPVYNIESFNSENGLAFKKTQTIKILGEDYSIADVVSNWTFYKNNTRIIRVSPDYKYWATMLKFICGYKDVRENEPFIYETAVERFIGEDDELTYFDPLFIDEKGKKIVNNINFTVK